MDYGSDGQMNGKTILRASGGATTWAWWSPWYKKFLGTGAGCVYTDTARTLGFTVASDAQEVYTITMCPYIFAQPKRKDSLSAWRSKEKIIADNTPLRAAGSVSGTMMHEIAHLVTKHGLLPLCISINVTGLE
ncbi:hypothetical protein N7536_002230 [Penicillium majusculum]|nr:hypothetical protein N7536_002230 [Penicillium majusculum]